MRNDLLPTYRVRAIQEELAGFFVEEVMDKAGEYYPFTRRNRERMKD